MHRKTILLILCALFASVVVLSGARFGAIRVWWILLYAAFYTGILLPLLPIRMGKKLRTTLFIVSLELLGLAVFIKNVSYRPPDFRSSGYVAEHEQGWPITARRVMIPQPNAGVHEVVWFPYGTFCDFSALAAVLVSIPFVSCRFFARLRFDLKQVFYLTTACALILSFGVRVTAESFGIAEYMFAVPPSIQFVVVPAVLVSVLVNLVAAFEVISLITRKQSSAPSQDYEEFVLDHAFPQDHCPVE